jgi:hypothetical protein
MTTKNLELYFQHAPLADLAALAATSTVGMVNGLIVEVAAAGLFEFQTPAVSTPDGRDVITGNGGGVWIRQTLPALTTTTGGAITISKGGTSAVTQQLAINSLAGAVTTKYYLRGDGTNVSMSAIQEGDLPALTSYETVFNGVEDPSLIAITYDAATRIFSVTYSTGAAWTVGGVRYTHAAGTVLTTLHANTTGSYYLYYNSSGVLTVANSIWNLLTDAPLASIYYNAANNGGAADAVLQYEIHSGNKGMPNATHKYLHDTRGTQLLTGGVATGYALNSATANAINWTTTQGTIVDEDIQRTVTAQALGGANTYRILFLTGTTAAPVWNWKDNAEDGIYTDATDIYYNQNNAGTWQNTAMTVDDKFVNYYIVATTAYNTPQIIVVMGQVLHADSAAASLATFNTDVANFGLFTNEAVVLYKVTYYRKSATVPGNARISAFVQMNQNLVSPIVSEKIEALEVGVDASTFTHLLSSADTTVQKALEDIDASFPVSIVHGGTGQTTQQTAMDALAGAVTNTYYLRGNGTNVVMNTIQAGDVPTLNQSTSGTAAKATNIVGGDANHIPYQTATDVTSFISDTNSAVLVTDGSGVPSLSTTLPAVVAGACTCTDPTTSSSDSINNALSNVYSAITPPLTYTAHVSAFSLNPAITTAQTITGAQIVLPAGKYLISYSASVTFAAVVGNIGSSYILGTGITATPSATMSDAGSLAFRGAVLAATDMFGGTGSASVVKTFAVPTTLDVAAILTSDATGATLTADEVTITAVRLANTVSTYSDYLVSAFAPDSTVTTPQAVTGLQLVLPIGTYLLSYSTGQTFVANASDTGEFTATSVIYNATAAANIASTLFTAFSGYAATGAEIFGGSTAASVVVTFAAPTTLDVYVTLSDASAVATSWEIGGQMTAVKLD